jgi:predicted flap endonuclease-1-like 5' DNA nuclease
VKVLVPSSGRGAFKALSALAQDWVTALEAGTLPAVGARLAGAAGALAAALDGTTHARALRKLKLAAVTIDRADRERHGALAQALRDALESLSLEEPPNAPSNTDARTTAHETTESATPPAPPAMRSTRRAPEPATPSAPSAAEARTLPPAPASAAHERLCDAELTSLPGVGPAVAGRLAAAGIRDIGDLLLLRPRSVLATTRPAPRATRGPSSVSSWPNTSSSPP